MLRDWLETLFTPCPQPLRRMGYLRELINIRKCQEEWGELWIDHFERTRSVLRAAMSLCQQHRKAVIFGSGRLYDVPLDELAATFREVILVDLLHPLSTRRRARRLANVRLLAQDVTGTIEMVYRVARTPGADLPRCMPKLFCDDAEIDLVASVNLLSQLPYLPVQYLNRAGVHDAAAIESYARSVITAHLDYLRRLPGTVALVADVEQLTVTPSGKVVARSGTVHGIPIPPGDETWTWPLLPRRNTYPHHGQHRRVLGFTDWKRKEENGPSVSVPVPIY